MATPITASHHYVGAAVRSRQHQIAVLQPDGVAIEQAVSVPLFRVAGSYGRAAGVGVVRRPTVSVAACTRPDERYALAAPDGTVLLLGGGRIDEEVIPGASARGPLRRIRAIEGTLFAVGMMRQVHRRDGAGRWTRVDTPEMARCRAVTGFETIVGASSGELCCAGWGGEIWNHAAGSWRMIQAPTNVVLLDGCLADDGSVILCGQRGVILRGRGDSWELVDHGGPQATWWSCCWYRDRAWLATDHGLFTLDGDVLAPVDIAVDGEAPETFQQLATGDGILVSAGPKDLLAFDGTDWTRVG